MRPEHWLFTISLRLRSLFRWAQADQDLDDELRDHLERRTEEYFAKGMTQQEARRRARLDLGGVEKVKEECRDARRVNWIQDLILDLRYGDWRKHCHLQLYQRLDYQTVALSAIRPFDGIRDA